MPIHHDVGTLHQETTVHLQLTIAGGQSQYQSGSQRRVSVVKSFSFLPYSYIMIMVILMMTKLLRRRSIYVIIISMIIMIRSGRMLALRPFRSHSTQRSLFCLSLVCCKSALAILILCPSSLMIIDQPPTRLQQLQQEDRAGHKYPWRET